MSNKGLDLLTTDEIFGTNTEKPLKALRKRGIIAEMTDLCILTGAVKTIYSKYGIIDPDIKGTIGGYYTKTSNGKGGVKWVDQDGTKKDSSGCWREMEIRPTLQSSLIYPQVIAKAKRGFRGVKEAKFGEYPQFAADAKTQELLENEYKNGLNKTGNVYTFNSANPSQDYSDPIDIPFSPITYEEYEYQGKKYVRVKQNHGRPYIDHRLSNGVKYKDGDYVWVEVSPVEWLIDEETETLISKRSLIAGLRFCKLRDEYDGNFDQTEIKQFLDKYMINDLTQSETFDKTKYNLIGKKDKNLEKVEEYRISEINRLLLIKQKLEEINELINTPEGLLDIKKINLEDIRSIVFKNNGNPTEKGYIEFDDFFKNNMILRMVDLSYLDLANVDIRNIDFSNTNIHIDPQIIYNKDMTGVNATNVHFSPFLDKFDDVTLDGAIITDPEAAIDLNKLKSYDENTIIGEKEIQKLAR